MNYATTPCRNCGEPTVPVTVCDGQGNEFPLSGDATIGVLVRMRDGEGGSVWMQDRTGELLARHVCRRVTQ